MALTQEEIKIAKYMKDKWFSKEETKSELSKYRASLNEKNNSQLIEPEIKKVPDWVPKVKQPSNIDKPNEPRDDNSFLEWSWEKLLSFWRGAWDAINYVGNWIFNFLWGWISQVPEVIWNTAAGALWLARGVSDTIWPWKLVWYIAPETKGKLDWALEKLEQQFINDWVNTKEKLQEFFNTAPDSKLAELWETATELWAIIAPTPLGKWKIVTKWQNLVNKGKKFLEGIKWGRIWKGIIEWVATWLKAEIVTEWEATSEWIEEGAILWGVFWAAWTIYNKLKTPVINQLSSQVNNAWKIGKIGKSEYKIGVGDSTKKGIENIVKNTKLKTIWTYQKFLNEADNFVWKYEKQITTAVKDIDYKIKAWNKTVFWGKSPYVKWAIEQLEDIYKWTKSPEFKQILAEINVLKNAYNNWKVSVENIFNLKRLHTKASNLFTDAWKAREWFNLQDIWNIRIWLKNLIEENWILNGVKNIREINSNYSNVLSARTVLKDRTLSAEVAKDALQELNILQKTAGKVVWGIKPILNKVLTGKSSWRNILEAEDELVKYFKQLKGEWVSVTKISQINDFLENYWFDILKWATIEEFINEQ